MVRPGYDRGAVEQPLANAPIAVRHVERTLQVTYPSIGDYALIGDCGTAALVARSGSIDWLCLPHFSGPAVFAALLDRGRGGHFAVRPAASSTVNRRYLDASNVLETTFSTATGILRITDAMPVAGTGGGIEPLREVVRVVEVVTGEVDVEVDYEPRFDFGRLRPQLRRRGALGWSCEHGEHWLLLRTDLPLILDKQEEGLHGRVCLVAGDRRHLCLAYVRCEPGIVPLLGAAADERVAATQHWWETWSDGCAYDGPFRDAVLRSALALKLMTYAVSGAVIAAPTMSLPERIGGVRNWDYRFCWLRDASLTLSAFLGLGYRGEAEAFLGWLLHATRLTWPELQVLYDVYGEAEIPERTLDYLEGYRGSWPVRIGNAAHAQRQLDVYGAVIQAAVDFTRGGGRLAPEEGRLLVRFGRTVCRLWRESDHGIWETRGDPRHFVFSKLMCWVALDRLVDLQTMGRVPRRDEATFRHERDAIRAAIESHGFDPAVGSYVAAFDAAGESDAALLLMARFGFHDSTDPRLLGTEAHIRRCLGHAHGLIDRYRTQGQDALPPGEGAFVACAFWGVEARARRGDREGAANDFEMLLTLANDVGLYSEEIAPDTGEMLGNFPQAFTHLALINAALALQAEATPRPDESRTPNPARLPG